jgi:pimeloyl-ACP methyl ester carboxylesterase
VAGVTERISEKAVSLGQQKAMVGIVTQPVAAELRGDRPAILILNTGIIHRVGHNRMYVNLSRALAQAGYVVLRFDLSGIGDSESRADGLGPLDAALADIRDAIDGLERARQAERVIICGLCSGADHAVLYGYTDPRVVGLVLMDPSVPPTARYYFAYIRRRLMRLRSWTNFASGRGVLARRLLERLAVALGLKLRPRTPSFSDRKVRSYLERVYRDSIALGIQFLAVFTAVEDSRQNYSEQLFDAFPSVSFGDQLRLEFFEEAGHTFMFESERVRLTQVIFDWLSRTNFTIRRGQRPPGAHDDIANAVSGVVGVIASGVGSAWLNLIYD